MTFRDSLRCRYRAFRWGLYYHHPLCCVIRYSLDHGAPAAKRGGKTTDKAGRFVPCNVFHHYDPLQEPRGNAKNPWRGYHMERKFEPNA